MSTNNERLQKSLDRLKKAEEALKPNQDKLAHLQKVANGTFYGEEESKRAGNEALAVPRRAKAFGAIAQQIEFIEDDKPISGVMLYDFLANNIQLFPVQADSVLCKEEFYKAALGDIYFKDPTELETYKTYVDLLWGKIKSSVELNVLKTALVNEHMATAMEKALEKKTQQRVQQGRQ